MKIVPDAEAFIELSEKENKPINDLLINDVLQREIDEVNKELAAFKRIRSFVTREQEFEKTTTQKIKRYASSNQD